MEEIIRTLSQLSLSSDPKRDLQHLRTAVNAVSCSTNTAAVHQHLDLTNLFDALNTSDLEQVRLAVEVLGRLLCCLRPLEVVERFRNELMRGLKHPSEDVRKLVLRQVQQCVGSEEGLGWFLSHPDMIEAILTSVGDESLGVVKVATRIVTRLCQSPVGLTITFTSPGLDVLKGVVDRKDSTRFSVYELAVEVGVTNHSSLTACLSSGLLDLLLSEVTTGDGLTQLTALQLLTPLALNPRGKALLDEKGVTARLMYLLSMAQTDPMARLLAHGLLEFLGNIGKNQPQQTLEQHSGVAVMVLQLASGHLDLEDPSIQASALQTVAHIGTTQDGKMALAKWKHEMDHVLDTLGTESIRGQTDLKTLCLGALTKLFHLDPQETREDVIHVLELWWANTLNLTEVFKLVRLPFSDIHLASLRLLTSLARLPWAQNLISSEPGLVEYILNRTTETEKEGMEAKWILVEVIVKSPSSSSTFPEEQLVRLDKYYRQGAFYTEALLEVALEGQD